MNKIRVLHVGLSSNIGGIETVVYNWFQNIDRNKIQFDFINVEDKPLAFEKEFVACGSKIYKISSRKNNPKKSNSQIKKILKEGQYDYVHHHVMGITWPEPTLIASKFPRTKPIIHNHVVFGTNIGVARRVLNTIGHIRLFGHKYLKLACGYEAGCSVFKNGTFEIINNGIDYEEKRFSSSGRAEIRKKYGIKDDNLLIGHVGRSSYQKNYPYLLKVMADLVKRNQKVRCMLVGDVNEDESVVERVNSLGLSDKVIFTGKVRNVEKYYSAFDVFFFPSHFEGVSVSMIEAQCSGLPCVISRNIAKETEISDLIHYIDINDVADGVKAIQEVGECLVDDRENVLLNPDYDIRCSVKKIVDFYERNLRV